MTSQHGNDDTPAAVRRLYEALVDDDEDLGARELDRDVAAAAPGNAAKQVAAMTLQKAGDLVVDAKTVLAWLLAALGAPAGLTGLLVPIRESGSMLPQVALIAVVRRRALRKWVWVAGGLAQAAAVLAMAAVAALLEGTAAGVALLALLAVFAVGRSLSSIASKDVLGRTLPKGTRGQITGYATIGAGVAAITVGLAMRIFGGADTAPATFAWLLAGAAVAWLLAAATYATVDEPPDEPADDEAPDDGAVDALALLRDDAPFRRFVVARSLLLVSALSPPFVVALANEQGGAGLAGLGAFVASSGLASLLGGRLWGRYADRSSRGAMMLAAGASSAVVVLFLAVLLVPGARELTLLYPATYLLLALAHTGSRIGRKTYVVDLAEGDRRTAYVAVSNSAMGVLLLVTGVVTSGVAMFGVEAALALLAALGVAGVAVSRSLPEVSAGAAR